MKPAKYLFFLLWLFSWPAIGQPAIPELWGTRIHDEAHILQSATIDSWEVALRAYEDSTSTQMAVLTIESLDGEDIESYSLRVAEKWKLGSAKNDNGVLLVVAVNDHAIRIEVGQGLEGALTDAQCNRIIRNEIAPAFRRNNYDEGISAGLSSIIKAIGGEYGTTDDGQSEDFDSMSWKERLLVGLFVFGIIGVFTTIALFSKGGMAWVLYFFLMIFYFTFSPAIAGATMGMAIFIGYVVGWPILKIYLNRHPKWKNKMMEWRGGRGGSWGSGGGWSSGGGGFSGGGGSFGGGGSSGSW